MNLRPLLQALLIALLIPLSGCAETFDASRLGVPVTMATSADSINAGTAFRVRGKELFGFWGLATLSSPSLQKVLAGQLAGGKAITNLRIKTRSRFTDVLITGLTLGLLSPKTVTFEGNIVDQ